MKYFLILFIFLAGCGNLSRDLEYLSQESFGPIPRDGNMKCGLRTPYHGWCSFKAATLELQQQVESSYELTELVSHKGQSSIKTYHEPNTNECIVNPDFSTGMSWKKETNQIILQLNPDVIHYQGHSRPIYIDRLFNNTKAWLTDLLLNKKNGSVCVEWSFQPRC